MKKARTRNRRKGRTGARVESAVVPRKKQVADAFDVSVNTVINWIRRGMPVRKDGRFDLKSVKAWLDEQPTTTGSPVSTAATERYRDFKAKLAELQYKKAVGEVLPRDEVEKGRVARILIVKRALLALPKSVAPVLVGLEPREIEALLTERVRHVIRQFAGEDNLTDTPESRQSDDRKAEGV